jgi:glycosyltransferase involved in cell wall biosynthesis
LRNELELDNDVFLIGFLGRFMAPKGFFYLVEAIDILLQRNDLPRRPLVLMFGEGGWFRAEMRSIQKKGLEGYFLSMPFTPNVASTIKALDVVTMPSLWEACGLLAMETLICGTPLIGSNCIGLREVLRGTPAKTVPKADADALAQALLQEMKMNRKEIFMSFRKTAAEKFDVTNTSQHILNLYQTLVR